MMKHACRTIGEGLRALARHGSRPLLLSGLAILALVIASVSLTSVQSLWSKNLVIEGEVQTRQTPPPNLCDAFGKPVVLTMEYTGDGDDATSHSQAAGKVEVVGDPNDASPVFIRASNKSSPNDGSANVYFTGVVALNGTFDIDATAAGTSKLKAVTFVHVFTEDGNTLLQTVEFHTSCSQPLFPDDQFGSVKLVGYVGEQSPTPPPTPSPTPGGPPVTTFVAIADTYVKQDSGGNDNFGTDDEMKVKGHPDKARRGLVAFDVTSIPGGSTIDSAILTLCLSSNPGGSHQGRTHELQLVTSSWVETTVVWNTQPTTSGSVTDTVIVPSTAQCLTFDVATDVQAWVDGTANHGWRIGDDDEATSSGGGEPKYRSRENTTTAERPKLEINFTP